MPGYLNWLLEGRKSWDYIFITCDNYGPQKSYAEGIILCTYVIYLDNICSCGLLNKEKGHFTS